MVTATDLGRALRKRRDQLGLKQSNLVDELKKRGRRSSDSAISRIESGERLEALRPLLALIDVLGLDLELQPRDGGPRWLLRNELTPELVALAEETGPEDRDLVLAGIRFLRGQLKERHARPGARAAPSSDQTQAV